jgi:hypothetical protein
MISFMADLAPVIRTIDSPNLHLPLSISVCSHLLLYSKYLTVDLFIKYVYKCKELTL